MMGDGTEKVRATNTLNNYSVIYYNNDDSYHQNSNNRKNKKVVFHCVSGITLLEIGNLYFNGILLDNGKSNGFIKVNTATGGNNPGTLNVQLCGTLSTSTEGVYTCTLRNSSMMNQSMSVGIYLNGRSKSSHNVLIS